MSDRNYNYEFFIESHKGLMDNLNHISDDLIKVKYYLLITISAIGVAYFKAYDIYSYNDYKYLFIFISIIGNLIFWLVSEYAISHGFLFRFIQAKISKRELIFRDELVKDPTDISNFIEERNNKKYLKFDMVLPDQFRPLYWISFWLIIFKTIMSLALRM